MPFDDAAILKRPADVYLYTSGPRSSGGILIVGEAWGDEELRERKPFCGYSGKELDRMLFDAGLNRADCLCTNLVDEHPPANDFSHFLERTKRGAETLRGVHAGPALRSGFTKLTALIDAVKPRLIIGCGNWPLWALTSHAKVATKKGYKLPSGIASWRGSQTYTDSINGIRYPYLPIFHPAAIVRDWSIRHITCQDLRSRAKTFITGKSSWDPAPAKYIADGSYEPLVRQLTSWIERADRARSAGTPSSGPAPDALWLAVDVETWRKTYLAVVGISDGETSICVPYFYFDPQRQMVDCFTLEQEVALNILIRRLLLHPSVRITNQNYSYDWQYLYRYLAIDTIPAFDTMLAHHLLWPGTPKGLDYLASLYCTNYCYWKDESQDWDGKGQHLDLWRYNCKDTSYTFEITRVLKEVLAKVPGMEERYVFQMEQWELANHMCRRGILWDRMRNDAFYHDLGVLSIELGAWLSRCMPEDLRTVPKTGKPWYSSTAHTQYIFYDRLGIAPILHKKTKQPTMDKESFEQIKKRSPWVGPMLDKIKLYRSVQTFRNNFLSAILGLDARMHPSFNVGGTETFRWSSSENAFAEGINLQNIPKLDEE